MAPTAIAVMLILDVIAPPGSPIVAMLGPTNTGKTHRAIERMLEHESGVIGLPLRLLAREVYDKLTTRVGESQVALLTGEEKRIPKRPRYWVCTVEAMPVAARSGETNALDVDFLAVDEIQLAAHPERGHVFTERLLEARGKRETWFLGAETMRGVIETLLPTATISSSPRFSTLTAAGSSPLGQLKKRTAIVAFSMQRVYEIAERVRARRGGAAIVLGALSPRARNAQVALYQSGEVDMMVATDAIGMGLNLDIDHVAFADLRKFDGREARDLDPAEIAQIAGRAGRHTKNGTFGTLAPLRAFSDGLARDLMEHRFARIKTLIWRSSELDMRSLDKLAESLDTPPPLRILRKVEGAEDQAALAALRADPAFAKRISGEEAVSLAWDVCRIPDYRQLLFEDHVATLKTVLDQLLSPRRRLDPDFLKSKLDALATPVADIEGLMAQLAAVRTWNYVSNQPTWVGDAEAFRERANAIENRLGDALHEGLVARFVDRSSAPRVVAIKPASKSQSGTKAPVESPFAVLANHALNANKAVPERSLAEEVVRSNHDELSLDASGSLHFDGEIVGKMIRGPHLLAPDVLVTADFSPSDRLRAHRRLVAFTRDVSALWFSDLDEVHRSLSPSARGLVHLVKQRMGTVLAADVRAEIASLSVSDEVHFARAGVIVGEWVVYLPRLLKGAAMVERQAFAASFLGPGRKVRWPLPSVVSAVPERGVEPLLYSAVGFPVVANRAVRADVLERVAGRLAAAPPEQRSGLPVAGWLGCKSNEVPRIIARASLGAPPRLFEEADLSVPEHSAQASESADS